MDRTMDLRMIYVSSIIVYYQKAVSPIITHTSILGMGHYNDTTMCWLIDIFRFMN